jgi:hypothetical protein
MKSKPLFVIIGRLSLVTAFLLTFYACDKTIPLNNDSPFFNFDVTFHSESLKNQLNNGSGFMKFRQDPDPAQIVSLETWVIGLQPKHAFLLQRAVDPITSADCTSTTWLTLGKLLVPQAIHTDALGNGHEELTRDLSAVAKGTEFRIHFQIIDSVTQITVLSSDCYRFTVR